MDEVKVTCKSMGSGAALFTIGYLKLAFWKGVLALVVWPYYLGVFFRK